MLLTIRYTSISNTDRRYIMAQKYCCKACDYVYNPQRGDVEGGIAPGVAFKDLPEDWFCPKCGVGKEYFEPVGAAEEE
jgi:rubredoxin